MSYKPNPIDTSSIELSKGILKLTETLAKNVHDTWAKERIAAGWSYGPKRDDEQKQHPCIVPYEELPESEKECDRNAAVETLKSITALGYRIKGYKELPSYSSSSTLSGKCLLCCL